jgi:hypothetical protein
MQRGDEMSLGVAVDPYGPAFTRHWQYNGGAAPIGGLPLTLLISGDLTPDDASVTVTVANNTPDRAANGTVQLNVPEGWKVAPARFDYELAAGEFVQERVVVLRHTGTAPDGGVTAATEFEGRTFRDVLTHGVSALALDVKRMESGVRVLVKNNSPLHAEGHLDVVTPIAWWPELGPQGLGGVTPRRAAVSVPPFREQRVLFRVSGDLAPPWMVLKLAANGETVYAWVTP